MAALAVATRELDCKSSIEAVWRVITDTDRMGRALGFDRIEVKPLEVTGPARHLITTKVAGLLVEYEEQPFEWSEPERFKSHRLCRRGPLRRIDSTWTLAPREGGGTRATVTIELEPSLAVLGPLARVAAGKSAQSHIRELAAADERLAAGQEAYALAPMHAAAPVALERASTALLAAVAGAGAGGPSRELAERLVKLVREGSDPDVGRLRPFELAARWKQDRRELLRLCLSAVQHGLLDLQWDLVCPSCRTASERLAELSDVSEPGHCQLCELSFGVDLDRAIEATFRPAAAVRVVEDSPLCISGPARTPHVVAQAILPAGGEARLRAPRAVGRYRLFVRGGAIASVDVEAEAAATAELTAGAAGIEPASVDVAPAGELVVRRDAGGGDVHVKLERVEWASLAATAYHVSTLPEFRRLFSSQVLRQGISLKVARAAILFSDLTASTALYAREGDAAAFRLVQEHFDVLRAVIEAHRGTVVKTIGDAIMAVFDDDGDAVRAAVGMQQSFEAFRAREELVRRGEVFLKVGVHAGPCYVVTANKILDYFGQSVNVAARLQGKAEAGEVVVSQELAERAGAKVRERFVTPIKGLEQPIAAARLEIA